MSFQRDEKSEEPGKQDFRGACFPKPLCEHSRYHLKALALGAHQFHLVTSGLLLQVRFLQGDIFAGESYWTFGSPPFEESFFVEFIVPVSFSSPSAWNRKKVAPTCFESRANKALLQLVPL